MSKKFRDCEESQFGKCLLDLNGNVQQCELKARDDVWRIMPRDVKERYCDLGKAPKRETGIRHKNIASCAHSLRYWGLNPGQTSTTS